MSTTFFASFVPPGSKVEPTSQEQMAIDRIFDLEIARLYIYRGGHPLESLGNEHWTLGIDQYGAIAGPSGSPAILKDLSSSSIYLNLIQDYGIACSAGGLHRLIECFGSLDVDPSSLFPDLESSTSIDASGICIFRGWHNRLDIGNDVVPDDMARAKLINSQLESIASALCNEPDGEFLVCYNSVGESFLPMASGNRALAGAIIGPRNQFYIGVDCLPSWSQGNLKIDETGLEENL